MKKEIKTIGVILAEAPHKEHGKRVTIFTKDFGRVTAFAGGAKKAKSHLLAATQPFVFGNFELYQGKEAYTLTGAEVIENFYDLRMHMDKTVYASYIAELSLVFMQENMISEDMLKLIYLALEEIVKQEKSLRLIRAIFEWKVLALAGYPPELGMCQDCAKEEDLFYFDRVAGGTICQECAKKGQEHLPVAIRKALQYIIEEPVEKSFRFRLKEELQDCFTELVHRYLGMYLDYPLKTEKIIRELLG